MRYAAHDGRVPDYLGRVLDASGAPAGTCFQVAPGWLATAWHVLEAVEAGDVGDVVSIDLLTGGEQRDASVAAIDELADLAVLKTDNPLPGSVAGLAATGRVELDTRVVVTGVSQVDDPDHAYQHLDAPGQWAGSATLDDQVTVGRIESKAVVPGMSGAPVRRQADDRVVGVVSARYNSADGWLRDTVWVARSERLVALCDDSAAVRLEEPPLSGALDLVLSVDAEHIRLSGGSIDVSASHRGSPPGLIGAIDDVRRARARLAAAPERTTGKASPGVGELALAQAGGLLAESFLQPPLADALGEAIERVQKHHHALRLGVACDEEYARLPWEALPSPAAGGPLALQPLVNVYRHAQAPGPQQIPGPLRILVAISSPLSGGGAVLDYERELRNVLAAVRAARQEAAHVRVVPFATTGAIRAALDAAPAHILHLSGHAAPGQFVFEDDDGAARELDADRFLDEAIPPGKMPPMVALSACYTNVSAATRAPSFARRMLERGASVVIASETSVTDTYATRVFARLYGTLAEAGLPDAVAAACDARRAVQAELVAANDERERRLAELGEWSVLSVLASSGSVPLFDPRVSEPPPPPPPRFTIGEVAAREVGEFVGRRAEQRRWPIELLASNCSGLVLHGIGGVGKTTLAAELVGRVLERDSDRVVAVLSGELSVEGLIGTVISALRRQLAMHDRLAGAVAKALAIAAQTDVPWADRIALLRENVLGGTPVLIVIDNFEDNLEEAGATTKLRDPVLSELLSDWIRDPAESRFLFTCRYPFELASSAERHLEFKPVGPLSAAETRKLVWSLPALDRLTDSQIEQAWRMVGGHPRALEYLDALLTKGTARYRDVRDRLAEAVTRRLGADAERFLTAERQLDDALAQVATLAADDVLLDELLAVLAGSAGATDLLIGASVYREPIDMNAILFQVGESDDAAATAPDRRTAREQIQAIVAASGVAAGGNVNLDELPVEVQAQIEPHLRELARLPTPPRRPPSDLQDTVHACVASSLLASEETERGALFFVHRWTSGELERRWHATERATSITNAHRRAADYWLWRVSAWPQDRRADVHDLLEARHHLLAAGELDKATDVAGEACAQLHVWGAYDDEAKLIEGTLRYLAPTSEHGAAWIHQLGILAEARGDPNQAETLYRRSLEINERLGNQSGMASSYGQLGILAEARGDPKQAETLYRRSLEVNERLGNQSGMASSYHQLGKLAEAREDLEQAEALYRQSLEIEERLGNQAGIAYSYHQLGILAGARGDPEQAEALYRRSLEIKERLGNQAGMATSYHQLGILAHVRGDLETAEALYRQSLEINERLGKQASMAITLSQLAILDAARGDVTNAIRLHGTALLIRARLGAPEISIDARRLETHRAAIGEELFLEALQDGIGPKDAAIVDGLLGEMNAARDDT